MLFVRKKKKKKKLQSPLKIQDCINQENKGGDRLTIRGGWRGPKWCGWGCWSRTDRGCHQAHFWMTLKENTDKDKKRDDCRCPLRNLSGIPDLINRQKLTEERLLLHFVPIST